MVRKILWCLPKNKWGPKVTVIKEAQDLKKVELDDLLGKLLTHEIHLKEDDGESLKKGIALKAIQEDCTSEEGEFKDNDEETFLLIVWSLNKIGLKKKFNQPGFNSKRSTLKRNEKFSKGKFFIKITLMLVLVMDAVCQDIVEGLSTNPKDGRITEI